MKKHTKDDSEKGEDRKKTKSKRWVNATGCVWNSYLMFYFNCVCIYVKDLNSFTKHDNLFLSHSPSSRCNVCIKKKNLSFVHWPLLQKSVFGLPFLCFFPPEHWKKMKNKILYRERERGKKKQHNTNQVEWMGKLNWKHILLGIWSITQLIMTFFSSLFIRDFLFCYTRSFRYFSSGKLIC